MDGWKLQQQILTYTGQDILELAQEVARILNPTQTDITKYGLGIEGIMQACGICKSTAEKMKRKGVFDKAIKRNGGRMYMVDMELANDLFKQHKLKRNGN